MSDISSFQGFRYGELTMTLIDDSNLSMLNDYLHQIEESDYFINELHNSYMPKFDSEERRMKYGFYITLLDKPAGLSLLGISSYKHCRGYTGADTFPHMRGKSIAPLSKVPLFYLAFETLNLNRVETGCIISNKSSQKSIEKTKGFKFEGVLKEYSKKADGSFEDELRYNIIKKDWLKLYNNIDIEIIL